MGRMYKLAMYSILFGGFLNSIVILTPLILVFLDLSGCCIILRCQYISAKAVTRWPLKTVSSQMYFTMSSFLDRGQSKVILSQHAVRPLNEELRFRNVHHLLMILG